MILRDKDMSPERNCLIFLNGEFLEPLPTLYVAWQQQGFTRFLLGGSDFLYFQNNEQISTFRVSFFF